MADHPDAAPEPSRADSIRRGVAVFRHRAYRVLYIALVARGLQVWMLFVALPLLVLELGGSATEIGIVIGLFLIPIAILAPVAGVIGDRVDRRLALVVLATYGAVHGLTLAALVLVGVMTIPLLALFAGLYGILNAAEIPIRLAFVADVVPKEDLSNGVVHGQIAFITSRVVGPAAAGLVVAGFGIAALFVLIGAAGVVVAGATQRTRPMRPYRRVVATTSPRAALADGLRYAGATRGVREPLLLLGVVAAFGLSVQAILPIYAIDRLHLDSHEFGLMLAVMGVGALVSAVPLAYLRPGSARRAMLAAAAGTVFAVGLLGATTALVPAFFLAAVAGAAGNVAITSASVAVQHRVAGPVRARVLGVQAAFFQGGQGIGGMAIGASTDAFGIVESMIGAAVILAVAAIVIWLSWPRSTPIGPTDADDAGVEAPTPALAGPVG